MLTSSETETIMYDRSTHSAPALKESELVFTFPLKPPKTLRCFQVRQTQNN